MTFVSISPSITGVSLLSSGIEFIERLNSFLIWLYFTTKVLTVFLFHPGNRGLNFLAALWQSYRKEFFAVLNPSLSLYTYYIEHFLSLVDLEVFTAISKSTPPCWSCSHVVDPLFSKKKWSHIIWDEKNERIRYWDFS